MFENYEKLWLWLVYNAVVKKLNTLNISFDLFSYFLYFK